MRKKDDALTEKIMLVGIIAGLVIILIPLLMIAHYTFPSSDDWTFGRDTYHAILEGGGLGTVLKIAAETSIEYYKVWQGSFSAIFLMTLQPGIWGEQYYFLTAYIMLGILIASELCLGIIFFKKILQAPTYLGALVSALLLFMQILFVPIPSQAFYWYNGAVYYTFFYGIMLLFFACLIQLFLEERGKKKVFYTILGSLLAVLVGSSNLATGLMTAVIVFLSGVFCVWSKKKKSVVFCIPCVVQILTFLANVFAPGQSVRQNAVAEHPGAIESVFLAVKDSVLYIYEWNHWYTIFCILFLVPICLKCIEKTRYKFRLPLLFSIISFGIFASQMTPIEYACGGGEPGRMTDIFYYSYWLLLVMNEIYWIGWIRNRDIVRRLLDTIKYKKIIKIGWYCIFGVLLACSLLLSMKNSSSYSAYRSLRNGQASDYKAVMDSRMILYHDESVQDVVVEPWTFPPNVTFYEDVSEDPQGDLNGIASRYYQKNSIRVRKQTE